MQILSTLCVVACAVSHARAQPSSCSVNAQCDEGSFCDVARSTCLECLPPCSSLKRHSPATPTTCIKSVDQCGPCYDGLVADHGGDVFGQCIPPQTQNTQSEKSTIEWVSIAIGALVLLAILIAILYIGLRKLGDFKALITMVRSRSSVPAAPAEQSTFLAHGAPASPPPPYDSLPHVLPTAPAPPPHPAFPHTHTVNENPAEMRKRRPSSMRRNVRESAGNQAAYVYNQPNYGDAPARLTGEEEEVGPEGVEEAWSPPHDDTTMDSDWTPGPAAAHNGHNDSEPAPQASVSAPGALQVATRPDLSVLATESGERQGPSNVSSERASDRAHGAGEPSTAYSPHANNIVYINVQVGQHQNNVKL